MNQTRLPHQPPTRPHRPPDLRAAFLATFASVLLLLTHLAAATLPTVNANLTFHLDADSLSLSDGAPVSTWLAHMGPDASQSNPSYRPLYRAHALNGHAAVDFDQADDHLDLSYAIVDSKTAFVVARWKELGQQQFYFAGQPNHRMGHRNGWQFVGEDHNGHSFNDTTSYHIHTYVALEDLYLDGIAKSVPPWTAGGGILSGIDRLGCEVSAAGAGLDNGGPAALIAEIILYDAELDHAERAAVEQHLLAKYWPGPKAMAPVPFNHQEISDLNPTLSWTPGTGAVSHDLYFGTDPDAVNNAARPPGDLTKDGLVDFADALVLINHWLGNPIGADPYPDPSGDGKVNLQDLAVLVADWQDQPDPRFLTNQSAVGHQLTNLQIATTYFWRIDELNDLGLPTKGDLWQFSTAAPPITFEPYDGTFPDGGVAWGDYNQDGYVDLLYHGRIYHNNAGTNFTQISPDLEPGIFADYDNDGDLDIFSKTVNYLYRNDAGTYTLVSFPTSPTSFSLGSCWFDRGTDGDVDIFETGYFADGWPPQLDKIFNNNTGAFAYDWSLSGQYGRGVTACDFDENGNMDVYICDYLQTPNRLYYFNSNGTFSDQAVTYGIAGDPTDGQGYGHSIGAAWGDLDDDGHVDLFVANLNHPDSRRSEDSKFYRNMGPAGSWHFQDMTDTAQMTWQESYASPALGDYDNDGDLDLFVTTTYATASFGVENHCTLHRNNGDWTFEDVTDDVGLSGLSVTGNTDAAWADFDNDGDLDLATTARLFINSGNGRHWLKVRLEGDGTNVSRDAIGTQVRITMPDGRILTRQVESGTGQGNQNDLTLHFGLGNHTGPVNLQVKWLDGTIQDVAAQVDNLVAITYDAVAPH